MESQRAMHCPKQSDGGAATPPMEVLRVAALIQHTTNEAGQTMAEYAVVLGVVSLIVVAALTLLSTDVATGISRVASFLTF
jgi:Flp pilus assembly pilin Flp